MTKLVVLQAQSDCTGRAVRSDQRGSSLFATLYINAAPFSIKLVQAAHEATTGHEKWIIDLVVSGTLG